MMRRLLTGGIKAIIAIAALSTAAHWVLRVQREPAPSSLAVANVSDPVTTGSIAPGKTDALGKTETLGKADVLGKADPLAGVATAPDVTKGLDQRRLSELFAGAAPDRASVPKAVARR